MSTIQELGAFLSRESAAVGALPEHASRPGRNGTPAGT